MQKCYNLNGDLIPYREQLIASGMISVKNKELDKAIEDYSVISCYEARRKYFAIFLLERFFEEFPSNDFAPIFKEICQSMEVVLEYYKEHFSHLINDIEKIFSDIEDVMFNFQGEAIELHNFIALGYDKDDYGDNSMFTEADTYCTSIGQLIVYADEKGNEYREDKLILFLTFMSEFFIIKE